MSDPTTITNSATEPLDNLNPTSLSFTGDGTHSTSTSTTTSSAAELIPATTTPSDPTLNSFEDVDTPILSRLREAPVDPRVVALRAMFPDYDDLILQSVLDSVDGNQNRAIDTLLGMSDPDYRSETRPVEVPALTQTELDEEFARRLMLEDQERQQQAWAAQQASHRPQRAPYSDQQQLPTPSTAPPASSGDTMGDIQQQFSRIAESGKKTFGNIFSKVKAKIQEFDQPKAAQDSGMSSQPAQWEASNGYNANQYYQPAPQGNHPYAVRQTYTAPQIHPALYDPDEYTPSSVSDRTHSPPITMSPPPRTSAIQGYDVTPDPSSTNSRTPPPPGISAATGNSNSPQRAPIDGVKLGLLPKRPVSLLKTQDSSAGTGSQNPHQIHRSASEDDSDGLEYTESPFEEHK